MKGSVARSGLSLPHVQLVMIVVATAPLLRSSAVTDLRPWRLLPQEVAGATRRRILLDAHQCVTGQPDPGPDAFRGFSAIRPDLEDFSRGERAQMPRDQGLERAAGETVRVDG